jgi:dihydrofolate reductase
LFDWYTGGPVAFTGNDPERVFHSSRASADYTTAGWAGVAAEVIGRRLFDITNGWNGVPAVGRAVFVVTHEPPDDWDFPGAPFTFVTEGVAAAVARAKAFAGDRDTTVTPGNVGGQALAAGLVDEIRLDLVPVVLGQGIRYFGDYTGRLMLDDPEVVPSDRVTHLRYRVRRS